MSILTLEQNELKEHTLELEFQLGAVGSTLGTLVDAEILLGQLVDSMDKAVYSGEETLSYHQHHRMIRVLSELIRYSLNDLSGEYEKADKTKTKIFNMVIKRGNEND
jgi:hypothetical protein